MGETTNMSSREVAALVKNTGGYRVDDMIDAANGDIALFSKALLENIMREISDFRVLDSRGWFEARSRRKKCEKALKALDEWIKVNRSSCKEEPRKSGMTLMPGRYCDARVGDLVIYFFREGVICDMEGKDHSVCDFSYGEVEKLSEYGEYCFVKVFEGENKGKTIELRWPYLVMNQYDCIFFTEHDELLPSWLEFRSIFRLSDKVDEWKNITTPALIRKVIAEWKRREYEAARECADLSEKME